MGDSVEPTSRLVSMHSSGFSKPGVKLLGHFQLRIEEIVVATDSERCVLDLHVAFNPEGVSVGSELEPEEGPRELGVNSMVVAHLGADTGIGCSDG